MPTAQRAHRFDEIACKWRDLALRRLDYYTELYSSGRWRRYYTQESFAVRMLDVVRAAKRWSDLVGQARAERPSRQDDDLRPAA
jgi:uncharacterized repeat protein (TIGR03809 family)